MSRPQVLVKRRSRVGSTDTGAEVIIGQVRIEITLEAEHENAGAERGIGPPGDDVVLGDASPEAVDRGLARDLTLFHRRAQ